MENSRPLGKMLSNHSLSHWGGSGMSLAQCCVLVVDFRVAVVAFFTPVVLL